MLKLCLVHALIFSDFGEEGREGAVDLGGYRVGFGWVEFARFIFRKTLFSLTKKTW